MPLLPTVLSCAVLLIGALSADDRLSVGDPAPALSIDHFVKGDRLDDFPAGKVTVVEFWATWCKPCIEGFPHLSELQERYADDVVIIGVSAEGLDKVEPFLAKPRHADVTRYRVASDPDGSMQTDWMVAARKNGIPCAFIVDREGVVQYIGHPMGMDRALERAITGKEPTSPGTSAPAITEEERRGLTTVDGTHSEAAAVLLAELRAELSAPETTLDFEQELLLKGALRMGGPEGETADLRKTRKGVLVLGSPTSGARPARLEAKRTMHLPGMPFDSMVEAETVLYDGDRILLRFQSDSPFMPSPLPTDGWTEISRADAKALADEVPIPMPMMALMEVNPLVASPLDLLDALLAMSALDVEHDPAEEDDELVLLGPAAPMAGIPQLLETRGSMGKDAAVLPVLRLEWVPGSGALVMTVGRPDSPSLTMRIDRRMDREEPDASVFVIDETDGEPLPLLPILRERMEMMRGMGASPAN